MGQALGQVICELLPPIYHGWEVAERFKVPFIENQAYGNMTALDQVSGYLPFFKKNKRMNFHCQRSKGHLNLGSRDRNRRDVGEMIRENDKGEMG